MKRSLKLFPLFHYLLFAFLVMFLALPQCKKEVKPSKSEKINRELVKMNTLVRITVYESDREKANEGLDAAFEEIDRVEKLMSTYLEESEVSLVNREAAQKPVSLSDEVFSLIKKSIQISKETKGAFDITVGPLLELWASVREKKVLPLTEDVDKIKERTGYEGIVLDETGKTIQFEKEGMSIDLGGIAKGYAIDAAIQVLAKAGITSALVDAGGDIYAMGEVGKRPGWDIGVHKPDRRQEPGTPPNVHCEVRVKNRSVVSSGNYERFVEIENVRYSHIVDPRTGMALIGPLVGVTLIGKDATTADAYCTALMVMGIDEGKTFVDEHPGFEAFFFKSKTKASSRRLFITNTSGVGDFIIRKASSIFDQPLIQEKTNKKED